MELGQRLRQARLEAGLSQRQLCGGEITRNMLSQIEHGTARPSMDTLRYLAARLEKPLSYFLDEDAVTSPNQQVMADARAAWGVRDYAGALKRLEAFQPGDAVFQQEQGLLSFLACLELAETALGEGRLPYGAELLARATLCQSVYITEPMRRRCNLLTAQARPERLADIISQLPPDDTEALLRARLAFQQQKPEEAGRLLDGAVDRDAPQWNLLRGQVFLSNGDYDAARHCFHRAEKQYPRETARALEQCYRELEDYKMAYHYACLQR